MIQDLTLIFFKCFLIYFFLFLLCFYFFYKNYYHFTKGKEPTRSPKPDSFEFELFTVIISSRVTPARFSRARLDAAVQSLVALLVAIRCLAPIGRAAEQLLGELRKDGAIALVMSG